MKVNKKLVITLFFLLVIPLIIAQTEKDYLLAELANLTAELSSYGYDANASFNTSFVVVNVSDVNTLLFKTSVPASVELVLSNTSLIVVRPNFELIRKYVSPPSLPEVELDFGENVNKTRLENCGRFSKNLAEIDSSLCPELNKSARITFFNIPFVENITVLRNGELCPADICTNLSLGQRISLTVETPRIQGIDRASFNVKSFSNYSLNGETQFGISAQASIDSVILNSTTGSNTTFDNLTAYPVNPVNASSINYDWRLNGSSIAVLNLPMTAPYNNGSRNLTFDFSTNNNVGELGRGAGTTQPVWNSTGIYGGAYEFDGSNDLLLVPDNNSLDMNSITTISFWMNASTDVSNYETLVSKRVWTVSTTNYQVFLNTGTRALSFYNGATIWSTTFVPTTSKWYHIVYTNNGSIATFYVNGTINATNTQALGAVNTGDLHIGGFTSSEGEYFHGSIDEVSIYNRSLSSEQIQAIYNASASRYDRLVPNETGGSGNNWTVVATPIDSLGLNGTGVRSNELIINNMISSNGCTRNNTPLGQNFSCNATIASITFTVNANVTLPNATVINMNLTNNGLNYTFSFNGTIAGQYNITWFTNDSTTSQTATAIFRPVPTINSLVLNSATGRNFTTENLTANPQGINGQELDNISINYDWRLNGSSIAVLNLPMTAPFNNGSRNLTFDFSTNNNVGVMSGTNAPTWNASGIYGGAYSFDGSNDFITTQRVATTKTTNITMHAWVNWNGSTNVEKIIVMNGEFGSGYGFRIGGGVCDVTGTLLTVLLSGVTCDAVSSKYNLPSNRWTFLALTRNSTVWTLWVNGTANATGTTNPNVPATTTRLGGYGAANFFDGTIDEVQIYNRSLSAEEIFAIYNNSAPRYDRLVPNETGGAGNNWTVVATPIDSLGLNGTGVRSNDLLIRTTTFIEACGRINESVTLADNVTDTDGGACFDFNTSNVVLDCEWHNVTAVPAGGIGINITTFVIGTQQFNLSNITIKNCNILNFSSGINISSAVNITLQNNNITNVTDGIWLNSTAGSVLTNNFVNVTTGYGVYLTNSSNNTITTNSIISDTNYAVYINSTANNVLSNNTISGRIAVYLSTTNNNNFTNNTLIGNTAFEVNASNNILITNSSFQNTNWSIKATSGSNFSLIDNERMTNYSFNRTPRVTITKTGIASILFINITNANGTNLSMDVNLTTANRVHVNTSRSRGLNVSANITFENVSSQILVVDYSDTGARERCDPPKCVLLSSPTGTTLTFNVSSFTTYQTDNPPNASNIILNSTTSYNLSNDNLTVFSSTSDPDGDNVTVNYDWRLNGSSIAVLNLPMTAPYNNGSMNFTLDFSSYNNRANFSGTTAPVWNASGISGGAYNFDGSNDFISVPQSTSLNVSEITISLWTKLDAIPNAYQTFYAKNNVNFAVEALIKSNGKLAFYVFDTAADQNNVYDGTGVHTLTANGQRWYYLAFTFNSTQLRGYVNGTLDRNITTDGHLIHRGLTGEWLIGKGSVASRQIDGLIDEFQIYNRSLSEAEIQAIYNNSAPRYDRLVPSEIGGAGNNWTVVATPIDSLGLNGTGVISNDLILLDWFTGNSCFPTSNSPLGQNFSCNATVPSTTFTVNANVTLPNATVINMNLTNNGVNYTFSFNATIAGQYNISWYSNHSTSSQNTSNTFRPVPTINSVILNSTRGLNTTTENLTAYPGINGQEFDNITINYDWRLNGSSIALLNLPMTAPYNNGSRNLTFDFSVYNNTGVLSGTAAPIWNVSGISGGAYNFDGSDDFISVPESASLNVSEITISLWTKLDSLPTAYQTFYAKNNANFAVEALIKSNGKLAFYVFDTAADQNNVYDGTGVHTLTANGQRWYYLAFTFNSTQLRGYVNGTLDRNITTDGHLIHRGLTGGWFIGKSPVASRLIDGLIDEFQIYNRSLSEAEIQAIYNNSAPRYDRLVPNEMGVVGNNWTVLATPIDSLGLNGTGVLSNNVTIRVLTDAERCGVVNASITLAATVDAEGKDCFNFNASNVVLDCAGYTVTSNPSGTVAFNITTFQIGTQQFNLSNITIQNCSIQNFNVGINISSANTTYLFNNNITNVTNGIWLNNTALSVLENNSVNATSVYGLFLSNSSNNTLNRNNVSQSIDSEVNKVGIYLLSSRNNVLQSNKGVASVFQGIALLASNGNFLINNTGITAGGAAANDSGIFLFNSSNNVLDNNTVEGTGSSSGLQMLTTSNNNTVKRTVAVTSVTRGLILTSSHNNTIFNNTFTANPFEGISMTSSSENNITGNVLSASIDDAFFISSSNNNSFNENFVTSSTNSIGFAVTSSRNNRFERNANSQSQIGLQFLSQSGNNTLKNNTFNGSARGVYIRQNSDNNTFTNNTIIGTIGIDINQSSNILITNTSFRETKLDIITDLGSNISLIDNERITNYSFANSPITTIRQTGISEVTFFNIINANGTNLSIDVNLTTANRVHVNTSRSLGLNVTANVTIFNTGFTAVNPGVSYADTSSFEICYPPKCVILDSNPSNFIFNISSFTTYKALETINTSNTFFFCDQGNTTTLCNITQTKYINDNNFNITADNLNVLSGGQIVANNSGTGGTQRIGFTINLTGNLTVASGGKIDLNGSSGIGSTVPTKGGQKGGNLTVYAADVFQLDGIVSAYGGDGNSSFASGGAGGNISIFVKFFNGTGSIFVNGGHQSTADGNGIGNHSGSITVNATDINFSGTISAIGGNGGAGCTAGSGVKGNGGNVSITAQNIRFTGTLNTSRGGTAPHTEDQGHCGVGVGGPVIFNATNTLDLNGSTIDVKGNHSIGPVTLQAPIINLNNSKITLQGNKTAELTTNQSFKITYNSSLWTNSTVYHTLPLITKDTGVGTIQFLRGVNLSAEDNPNDLIRIADNNITVDTANAKFPAGLNVTANITIFNQFFPFIRVSFANDVFESCKPDVCSDVTNLSGRTLFNVSHFTTYQGTGGIFSTCRDINESGTLTQNVNISTGDVCFNVTGQNLTFDCRGYNITANPKGKMAFNISNNITYTPVNVIIKNCNILNFTVAINISSGVNITLLKNNITNVTEGIRLNNSLGISISDNFINATGSYAIYLSNSTNNTINGTTAITSENISIELFQSSRNILINNTLKSTFIAALIQSFSNNNNLTNTTVIATTGFEINASNIVTIAKSSFQNTSKDIKANLGSNFTLLDNERITNYTFVNVTPTISFSGLSSVTFFNATERIVASGANLSQDINLTTLNKVHVNSSRITGFNTTGNITIFSPSIAAVKIDINDVGTFVPCPVDVCSPVTRTSGISIFNVSHFTTFLAVPAVIITACQTVNETSVLINNITDTDGGSCLDFNASNINLDCFNYNISSNPAGLMGINISTYTIDTVQYNLTNITIQNCNIFNFTVSINASYTTNLTLLGNNIFNVSDGLATNNTAGLNLENNTINTTIRTAILLSSTTSAILKNNTINGLTGLFAKLGTANASITNNSMKGTTAFEINSSSNITITNTSFQNTFSAIKSALKSNFSLVDNERITNYSFEDVQPTITIRGSASVQYTQFITARGDNLSMDVNLTNQRVHVNSSRTTGLNATANITIFNSNSEITRVAYDEIIFEDCPPDVCTAATQSNNNSLFSVTHFTTYTGSDLTGISSCRRINKSGTLTQNIISSGNDCLDLNTSNILLNCINFNITSNPAGIIGINISRTADFSLSNITIKNCNIQNFSTGINISSAVNITLTHNNIFNSTTETLGINNTAVVRLENNTFNGTIYLRNISNSNITLNTFQSSTGQAVLLYGDSHNNLFKNNTVNGLIAFFLNATKHIDIINNTFIGGIGIELNFSDNITISNSSFQDVNLSIRTSLSNFTFADFNNKIVTNYSFNNSKPTFIATNTAILQFLQSITSNGTNLSRDINLTSNRTFVNTTNSLGFNTSANITLFNLAFSNPQVIVTYSDSGQFELCNATICSEISFSGSYIFNVSHFTIFAINETPPIALLNPRNDSWVNRTTGIIFDWSDVFGATTYVFNLTNATDFLVQPLNGSVTDSNFTNDTVVLLENFTYYWFVTAFDEVSNKTNSTIGNFRIDAFAPTNITFGARNPANGSAGISTVSLNWTAIDNLNSTLSCAPTVDRVIGTFVPTINNTYQNATITMTTGGQHNLTVTCFDNANANVTNETIIYFVMDFNISRPFNGTVVRPFDEITIDINETFGPEFIDQINVTVDGVAVVMTDRGDNNWTATYTIANQTPRILNLTAFAYQKSTGVVSNITYTSFLRLDRPASQAQNITQVFACSNQTYVLNTTNVTIRTVYTLDTLVDSINLTITEPDSTAIPLNTSGTTSINSTYVETNYSFIATKEGKHNISGVLTTVANQTHNTTIELFNTRTNVTLNISGQNLTIITLRDICGDNTLNVSLDKMSLIFPNNSRADVEVNFGDPVMLNFTPAIFNNSVQDGVLIINVSTDYTRRTNETGSPTGQRRIAVWDNNITNINYGNITLAYNYSTIAYTISSERNLQLYRCDNISNCNLEKQDITRDTERQRIYSIWGYNNLSRERFMLTEPAVTNPDLLKNPQILEFNLSRKYPAVNSTVNITINFNMSLAFDNLTLSVNGTRISPMNITTITTNKQFIYRYNYTPTAVGPYAVLVNITDENTFTTNATKVFYANLTATFNLSTTGVETIELLDLENNVTIANTSSPPLLLTIPPGKYNSRLINTSLNLTLLLQNFTAHSTSIGLFTIDNFSSPKTFNVPANRTYYTTFRLNTTTDYERVDITYNYSRLLNDTVRERNLQLLKCAESDLTELTTNNFNCTNWADTLATVDVNATTLRASFSNLSLFLVAEAFITTTITKRATETVSAGGGGGVTSAKKTVAALSFVTPKQPLVMYGKDEIIALFIVKNTGKITLADVKLDAFTDTKDLSLRLERTTIPTLDVGTEVPVRLFITSHTEPAPYEITVTATASNVPLAQTSKIYITLQRTEEIIVTEQMLNEMRVAEDILQKNPKCIELKEFIAQAEAALKDGQYEKARSLASAAIEGCQELIAYSAELEKPAPLIDLEKFKNYLIIGLAFISIFLLIIGYLLGVLGKHQHAVQEGAPRRKAITVRRLIGAGGGRNVAVGKLAGLLKKRRTAPLPVTEIKQKQRKGFISRQLSKAPGAPFYMPRAMGR